MDNETLAGIVSLTDIAIRQPELIESLKNGNGSHGFVDDIYQLLNLSEGQRLEFKSSLRYDLNTRQVNQNLESARAENDYLVIRHQNRDGFENHLLGLISNCIGNYYLPYVGMIFHNVLGKDLCQINIRSTPKPAFLNNCGKQEFYVRTGNASRPFSISDASEYIQDRWG